MEENIENVDSPNDEVIVEPKIDEVEPGLPADPVEVEPKDDEVDDVEALKLKNQELYEQLRKARGYKRDPNTGKWIKPEPKPEFKPQQGNPESGDLTIMELKSLLAANVHDDSDTEEVRLYARSHKISVTEALKLPEVKSLLKTRIEYRKSAEVANTSNVRRSVSKTSMDELIAQMESGKIFDDPELAARVRHAKKERDFKDNKR